MPQNWFTVRAMDDQKTVNVSVRGIIAEFGVSDREFIREVEAAGDDVEMINVTINSRGGEVDHGLAIYNFLRNHKALVSVRIDGIAASSASVIAMAADEIIMPANALMMVHNPWTIAMGNAEELRKTADDLQQFETALMSTYTARTGRTDEEVRGLLGDETWLTAQEAVELGFADQVEALQRPAAVALAESASIPQSVIEKIDAIEAESSESPGEPVTPGADAGSGTPGAEPPAAEAPEPTERDNAAALVSLCVEKGAGAMASAWVKEGISLEEAGKRIAAARALEDESAAADHQITPGTPEDQQQHEASASWNTAFAKAQPKRGNF